MTSHTNVLLKSEHSSPEEFTTNAPIIYWKGEHNAYYVSFFNFLTIIARIFHK